MPEGPAGEAIPSIARIALIAQVVDVFFTAQRPEAARRGDRSRAGTWFDPALVDAFDRVATKD